MPVIANFFRSEATNNEETVEKETPVINTDHWIDKVYPFPLQDDEYPIAYVCNVCQRIYVSFNAAVNHICVER